MSDDDRYPRVCGWYATTAQRRAEHVHEHAPGAWSVLSPRWPRSFVNNGLVLTADPRPGQVVGWLEESLGGAGLEHRHLSAFCHLSAATLADLTTAGYELQPEVVMARPATAASLPVGAGASVSVVAPDDPAVQALQARLWHEEWLPSASDDTVAELLGRRVELGRAGPTVTLAVATAGEVLATVDVCTRDGVAEVDGLATLPSARGAGLAGALMAAGVAHAVSVGCDLVVLTALVDDWPRDWYARLGFDELGPATEATRS